LVASGCATLILCDDVQVVNGPIGQDLKPLKKKETSYPRPRKSATAPREAARYWKIRPRVHRYERNRRDFGVAWRSSV